MIYKINFKRDTFQLIRLAFSSDKKFKEINVNTVSIPFVCNRALIQKGEDDEQVVESLNDLLNRFQPDITELFLSFRKNFFQSFEISYPKEVESAEKDFFISWQINQFLTDDSKEYYYGYFKINDDKLKVFVIRKNIHDYFKKLFSLLDGSFQNIYIGFDFEDENKTLHFIKVYKELTSVISNTKNSKQTENLEKEIKLKNSKIEKKSFPYILVGIFLLLVILSLSYYSFSPFFGFDNSVVQEKQKVVKEVILKDSVVSQKIEPIVVKNDTIIVNDKSETDISPKAEVSINSTNNINVAMNEDVDLQDELFKNIIYQDVYFMSIDFKSNLVITNKIQNREKFDKYSDILTINEMDYLTSFQCKNTLLDLGDKIVQAESKQYIFHDNKQIYEKILEIKTKNLEKIVVSKRNNNYYLVVDFD